MPPPKTNPHVARNNSKEEALQEHESNRKLKKPYPMIPDPRRLRKATPSVAGFLELQEDKERLDWLEENGATWQIPFVEDQALGLTREKIDFVRRKQDAS
jgi:hypothetical protein